MSVRMSSPVGMLRQHVTVHVTRHVMLSSSHAADADAAADDYFRRHAILRR